MKTLFILLALTFSAFAGQPGLPLYTTAVTAQALPVSGVVGTAFHIGIEIGGKLQTYTITFYVVADPTPTPSATPTPKGTP